MALPGMMNVSTAMIMRTVIANAATHTRKIVIRITPKVSRSVNVPAESTSESVLARTKTYANGNNSAVLNQNSGQNPRVRMQYLRPLQQMHPQQLATIEKMT